MKKLTLKNFKEAKNDLQQLSDPASLCCGDGYYANSLIYKWGDLNELTKKIKAMEEIARSTNGAGI